MPNCLRRAHAQGGEATDDAALVEALGATVRVVPGDPRNLKITTPADLGTAESLLERLSVRIGQGIDIHRFSEDPHRPLVLGGVVIEGARGLGGHSDADAVCHAISDAVLGAVGLGDLGRHFPDTDPVWEGANSVALLDPGGAAWRASRATCVRNARLHRGGRHAPPGSLHRGDDRPSSRRSSAPRSR